MSQHSSHAARGSNRVSKWGVILGVAGWPAYACWVAALTILFFAGYALPATKFFSVPSNYLPLHTAIEFLSIAISIMVFGLTLGMRQHQTNNHLIILGVGLLTVGFIDFAHTLSFAGMPDWITPSGPEKAINFWIAGRYVSVLVLLSVALLPLVKWSTVTGYAFVVVAAIAVSGAWWVGLDHPDWLPRTFIAGQGLTAFKVGNEYLLTGMYGVAAYLLFRKDQPSRVADLRWLAAAAWVQRRAAFPSQTSLTPMSAIRIHKGELKGSRRELGHAGPEA